jgi:hypothetical protein
MKHKQNLKMSIYTQLLKEAVERHDLEKIQEYEAELRRTEKLLEEEA